MDATTVTAAVDDARAAAPERDLLLQRTLFSGPRKWVNDDLYSRVVRGLARRTRAEVHLEPGAIVETNTYFGRFEASYWQRWTSVSELTVRVSIECEGQLDVLVRASDIGSHVRTVDVAHHHGDGMAVLDVPVDTFTDGGAMWLEFHAVDAPATVSEVTWGTTTTRPARRAAVAICTFNRADDCAATVEALSSDPLIADLVDDLYVTDQVLLHALQVQDNGLLGAHVGGDDGSIVEALGAGQDQLDLVGSHDLTVEAGGSGGGEGGGVHGSGGESGSLSRGSLAAAEAGSALTLGSGLLEGIFHLVVEIVEVLVIAVGLGKILDLIPKTHISISS